MNQIISKEFKFIQLLQFAAPSIIMMVFLSLYTIVDGFFVSHYVGTDALSSVNITYPFSSIFVALGVMFATGGSAVVATRLGEKKIKDANNSFSLIVLFCSCISILLIIPALVWIEPLVKVLGAEGNLIPLCMKYLFIQVLFSPIAILQILFQNFFVTAGKPSFGLILTVIAGLCNMLFDFVFLGMMHIGIEGAAYASAIGYCIPALGGILFFIKNKQGLHFIKPNWNKTVLIKSSLNGSSEMVTNLSVSVTTFLFNVLTMKYLGPDGVAAITVILYCQFLMTSLFMGFSIGVAPVISYHYGAENLLYLKKLKHMCWKFVIFSSFFVFVFSLSCTELIAALFSDQSSDVYSLICRGMSIFSVSFLFAGINIFASAMFTAISDGKTSAMISFSRTFLFIIVGFTIMIQLFHVDGIWLSMPFAEFVTLLLVIWLLYRREVFFKRDI
ncbi:MAG: MATE family efflux transporter [Anaerovorax sp.]|nr:MATE family efflux transporter [Anaerovorax sp.]